MDDLDPVARLRLLIEQAAELDALADIAASRGLATPGVDALLLWNDSFSMYLKPACRVFRSSSFWVRAI